MAEDLKKNFSMTYADLIGICDNIHSNMNRDAAPLLVYGVTPLKITAFKTKIDEFLAFPTDSNLLNDVVRATQNRNDIGNELKIMLRSFGVRAKTAFTNDKGEYAKFIMSDLSHAIDDSLIVFSEMVAIEAVKELAALTPVGVTQELIDELVAKTDEFRDAIIAQTDTVKVRDGSANLRIKKANELYGLLVNYTDYGKDIWYETNEAYYNDYLIYDNYIPGTLTAPENLTVDVATMTFSWSPVENATSYVLLSAVMGSDEFETVYSGSDNFINYVPPYPGLAQYKVKARSNSGYGPESGVMLYNYHEPVLAEPQNVAVAITSVPLGTLEVTWNSVEGATYYKVFTAKVEYGFPAPAINNFNNAGTVTGTSFEGFTEVGKRQYYYVRSYNDYLESVESAVVWVER